MGLFGYVYGKHEAEILNSIIFRFKTEIFSCNKKLFS